MSENGQTRSGTNASVPSPAGGRRQTLRSHARAIFEAGLAAVDPQTCIRRALRLEGGRLLAGGQDVALPAAGRVLVVGAGKASALMARAVEELLGPRVWGGLVVVKYGHGAALDRVQIREAGHPLPDDAGRAGAAAVFDLARQAGAGDLVLCLISGGGSALLPLPVEGIDLKAKQATTELLLASGATIHEVNAVRKHLSRIKGGGLARAAAPARVVALILSDVVGDDLDVIASGPTAADPTTFGDGLRILRRYGLLAKVPPAVRRHLKRGAAGEAAETPKPGDPVFERVRNLLVGGNRDALLAAAAKGRALGYNTVVLSSMLEGEAREAGRFISRIAREARHSGNPAPPPACILCGGETTVTVRGGGRGGRNTELALAAALDIAGEDGLMVLSAGTDGSDGPTDAAGAFADWKTLARAQEAGLDPARFLDENDSYRFFDRLGDLLKTGPTRTNVMDLQIALAAC
ncbi:MAG: glycerate kinase [Desulfobacteraceae bacterium]|nr:glycerate kinase [Desulfobacteraceae bacterium]